MTDKKKYLTRLGQIFYLDEEKEDIIEAIQTKHEELGLDSLIFESADFAVSGGAILERHENKSPDGIPYKLRYYSISPRHPDMTTEQMHKYREMMLKAGFTYRDAIDEIDRKIRDKGIEETFSWLEEVAWQMEACDVGEEDILHPSNRTGENIPPAYGFHKVDDMYRTEEEPLWFDKQPHYVQRLITTPRRCKSLKQLTKLGKKIYEAEDEENKKDYQQVYLSMTNDQRSVFWGEYNERKRDFLRVPCISDIAKGLIAQIKNSSEETIERTKARLAQIQNNQINIRDPPEEKEWNLIWNHYKQREYEIAHPLPELPEGYSRCGYCQQNNGIMYMPKIDILTGKMPEYERGFHCLDCTGFYD